LEYHEESISELLLAQGSVYNCWENSDTIWASQPTAAGNLICEVLHGGGLLRRLDKRETSTVTLAELPHPQ